MKRKGVTAIYTHQILRDEKGNALKRKACRLFSFSEKEKEMMKGMCDKLGLSDLVYEEAKAMYYKYLEEVYKTTGLGSAPKFPIVACIYLSAIKNKEYRYKREICDTLGGTPPAISNWARKISDVLRFDITWAEVNTQEQL